MKTIQILVTALLCEISHADPVQHSITGLPALKGTPGLVEWTAFQTAIESGDTSSVERLIAGESKVDVRYPNGWKRSLLHVAAAAGVKHPNASAAITKMLIEAGADVNSAMLSGFTPLHEAARTGSEEVAKVLIENGASLNRQISISHCLDPDYDFDNATPLDAAIVSKKPQIAALLRKSGAKTKAELEKAARQGGVSAIQAAKQDAAEQPATAGESK